MLRCLLQLSHQSFLAGLTEWFICPFRGPRLLVFTHDLDLDAFRIYPCARFSTELMDELSVCTCGVSDKFPGAHDVEKQRRSRGLFGNFETGLCLLSCNLLCVGLSLSLSQLVFLTRVALEYTP